MIRFAVVGVNRIGNLHCRAYARHPDAALAAVCDLNAELAGRTGEQFGAAAYTDVHEMLANERIDAVAVATGGYENGSQHYGPVMAALEAGKDVLVEKPISNDIGEARRMVAFAKERGLRLACNLNHRFSPAADKAKALIAEGRLGELLFLNMRLTIRNPNESAEWLHLRALHPHSIDVLRFFGGEIARVQAFMTRAPGRTVWSTASVNLQFASGAVGHLTGSYDMSMRHPVEFCEVAGTDGRLTIDNVYEDMTFYPHQTDERTTYRNPIFGGMQGFDDTFHKRIDRFVDQLEAGDPPERIEASGDDALAAQEVIEAAIASFQAGGVPVDVRRT